VNFVTDDLISPGYKPRLSFAVSVTIVYGLLIGLWLFVASSDLHLPLRKEFLPQLVRAHDAELAVFAILGAILFWLTHRFTQITERAQQEIAANERRYHELIRNALVGMMRLRASTGEILECNEVAALVLGFATVEECQAQPHSLYDYLTPDVADQVRALLEERGEMRGSELPLHRADGSVVWSRTFARLRPEIDEIEALGIDITEEKRAQDALDEAHQFSAQVITSAAEGIIVYDHELRCLAWNPFMEALTGIPATEILGTLVAGVFPTPRAQMQEDLLRRALAGEVVAAPDTWYHIPATGRSGWIVGTYAPYRNGRGDIIGVIGLIRDITERKRIEEELTESEERYRSIFANTHTAMLLIDPESGAIVDANPGACELYGFSRQTLLAINMRDLAVDTSAKQQEITQRVLHELLRTYTTQHRMANGVKLDVEVHAGPIYLHGRTLIYAIILDITEQKNDQEALLRNERFLTGVFTGIQDGLAVLDNDYTILRVNDMMEHRHPRHLPLIGKKCYAAFHERTSPCDVCPCRTTYETGQPATEIVPRTDGDGVTTGWLEVYTSPFLDTHSGQVTGVIEYVRDVTEQRRLDDELRKMAKLDSLGTLAGGIAHDFNNILTTISGNLELAGQHPEMPEAVGEKLAEVQQAALRARDLTQQLLTFSHDSTPVRQITDLRDIITDAVIFALSGAGVSRELTLAPDLWPAEVDAGQFAQLIQNLTLNAVQAMPGGGTLHVSADNATLHRTAMPLAPGPYVQITVRDEGEGIAPEVLPRIFDPFFTTREKGTGLGLTTAFTIAQDHGGHLAVESRPGAGATFTVYLPAMPPVAAPTLPARGHGRVLVMDDEAQLRTVVVEMLIFLGYQAEGVPNGDAAVTRYREALDTPERFDAVILDLTVPGGMGGADAVAALHALDSHVCALASSGYTHDPIMADSARYGFAGAIGKPYRLQELSDTLARVLQATRV
jgi:PAS domain S-box-containing protein